MVEKMEDLVPQSFLLKVYMYLAIFSIMILVYSERTVTGDCSIIEMILCHSTYAVTLQ